MPAGSPSLSVAAAAGIVAIRIIVERACQRASSSRRLTSMVGEPLVRRKAEVLTVLRRAGYSERTVAALDAELDDPVDLVRDANVLLRHGITIDSVIDRMGGSP